VDAHFEPRKKGRGRLAMTYETPAGNGVALMNLDSGAFHTFATPFNIHYIETSKKFLRFAVGANKYGRNFAEFDLENRTVTRTHQVDEDLSLMGHMAISDDGKAFCATAIDSSNRNLILKIDPKNFQILKRINIGADNPAPHDLRFIRGSRTLLTTSANQLTHIDFATSEVRRTPVSDLARGSVVRHFGISEEGRVAIQANSIGDLEKPIWKYGRAEIVTASHNEQAQAENVRTLHPTGEFVAEFEKELLDFAFSADGSIFGATMNHQPLVTFWDFSTGQMRRAIQIPGANRIGLTFDQSHFMVFTRFGVRYISARTLEHVPTLDQFDIELAQLFPKSVVPVFAHKTILEPT
jgi:hypothetical protein